MNIKQLSVFIENKKGHLAQFTSELKSNDIDVRAIAVFDTTEFGILRVVVNDTEKAIEVLKKAGYVAKISEVLAVELNDEIGALNEMFTILNDADVSVEYTYSYVLRNKGRDPLIVIKVDDNEKAIKVLLEKGMKLAKKEDVYNSN